MVSGGSAYSLFFFFFQKRLIKFELNTAERCVNEHTDAFHFHMTIVLMNLGGFNVPGLKSK
jgi:hypothetical protein